MGRLCSYQYGYAVGRNSGSMSNLYVLNSYMYSLLWQAGGDIYTDDLKEVAFNGKAGVEALEFFKSLQPYMPENAMSLSGQDAFSTVLAPLLLMKQPLQKITQILKTGTT